MIFKKGSNGGSEIVFFILMTVALLLTPFFMG